MSQAALGGSFRLAWPMETSPIRKPCRERLVPDPRRAGTTSTPTAGAATRENVRQGRGVAGVEVNGMHSGGGSEAVGKGRRKRGAPALPSLLSYVLAWVTPVPPNLHFLVSTMGLERAPVSKAEDETEGMCINSMCRALKECFVSVPRFASP